MPMLWISYSGCAGQPSALPDLLVGGRWAGGWRCPRNSQHGEWRFKPRTGADPLLPVRCVTPAFCSIRAQTWDVGAV